MNTTSYLNLDVLVESQADLTPLVDELGERVLVLCNEPNPAGGYYLAFELPPGAEEELSPQVQATSVVTLLSSLSAGGRRLWDSGVSRFFDFGFESGHHPNCIIHDLDSEILKAISSLGAQVRISIYAVPEPPNHLMHSDGAASGPAGDEPRYASILVRN